MRGEELRRIARKLDGGLSKNELARELGYRGNPRNNSDLINAYYQNRKQIPLTVASLAWLIEQWFDMTGETPDWPDWEGYDEQKGPPLNFERDAKPKE
jgi:hypothetical protein